MTVNLSVTDGSFGPAISMIICMRWYNLSIPHRPNFQKHIIRNCEAVRLYGAKSSFGYHFDQ